MSLQLESGPNVCGKHAASKHSARKIFVFNDLLIVAKPHKGNFTAKRVCQHHLSSTLMHGNILKQVFNIAEYKMFPINRPDAKFDNSWQLVHAVDRTV